MSDSSKTYPRDVFLYLLSIITLITVAVSLGFPLYGYIDIKYPDQLTDSYYWSKTSTLNSIRNSMAVLMVVFPVFLWVSWFLRKNILREPQKRELKIRRWLLYLTLFIASLVIIGDLIALLVNFLNGELTTRFILKVLAVLAIAGSVVVHYFSELRDKSLSWVNMFDKFIILLLASAVISGFWIAGSPAQQRAIRFDERRASDLSLIQSQIIEYWQRKQKLPLNLMELANDINGFTAPKDPESGADYDYKITTSPYSFELCAVFKTSNFDEFSGRSPAIAVPYRGELSNWVHGKGMTCFERTIDPDFYPSLKDDIIKPRPL